MSKEKVRIRASGVKLSHDDQNILLQSPLFEILTKLWCRYK